METWEKLNRRSKEKSKTGWTLPNLWKPLLPRQNSNRFADLESVLRAPMCFSYFSSLKKEIYMKKSLSLVEGHKLSLNGWKILKIIRLYLKKNMVSRLMASKEIKRYESKLISNQIWIIVIDVFARLHSFLNDGIVSFFFWDCITFVTS
jgi:hypothetical protein